MLVADYSREAMLTGMEEVLITSPDDVCMHRAYASSLLPHRDPAWAGRGRFIETQLKLEEANCPPEQRRKLEARRRKLLKDHGRVWLGSLSEFLLDEEGYRFEMARGWLDAVRAPGVDARFVALLVRAPQARLLRSLVFDSPLPDGFAALPPLLHAPFLGRLRELRLGDRGHGMEPEAFLRQLSAS